MITRRRLIGGLALAGAGGAVGLTVRPGAAEPPPETTRIRLVQTPSMCQAPQYVAEELLRAEGFAGVEYIKKEGPYDITDALASGEVDVNLHFSARLVVTVDRGAPVTILAGVHPGCYELFTAQPMRTLRDLKGRTVAIRAIGGPEHVFISSMAAYVGLDPQKDITWVTHPSATSIELLAQGKIDAFLGFPPRPRQQQRRPALVPVLLLHGRRAPRVRSEAPGRHQACPARHPEGDGRVRRGARPRVANSRGSRTHSPL
jgi:NitT/TauT family transport system substrate-binding protein